MMSFFVGFAFFELGVFCGFFAASLMPDETALRELSEQVIEKLKRLTDAEFAGLEFPMN